MPPKKIAVLGGGLASIASVFKLTEDPNWKTKYDITVYQIGWRLGGKCASGRNSKVAQSIEEHGLHLWFGFYDNAFDMIQRCYNENARPADSVLATWEKAFKGYDSVCLEEELNSGWEHWLFTLSANGKVPGYGDSHPTKGDYIHKLFQWLKVVHDDYNFQSDPAFQGVDLGQQFLSEALIADQALDYSQLDNILMKYKVWLTTIRSQQLATNINFRRLLIQADLAITIISGMINDSVLTGGFKMINKYDFREWLRIHGAATTTVESAIVQGIYGLVFGGKNQYTFEAGTALRGVLRMFLTYKGHVYFRMMAGMADVVFTPFYEVLKKRGVKFEFFSKVSNINLTSNKAAINTVEIDIQATLKPNFNSYNPLIEVNGLQCWPSQPDYDQLLQGEELERQHVDLESYYSTWKAVDKKILLLERDFDSVILGISIGAFPSIAAELIQQNVKWQRMVKNVVSIPTLAFQVWLKCSINDMQWPFSNNGLALLGSYQEPYDTWSDMSELISREAWPASQLPRNSSYFCGPTPKPYADQIMLNVQTSNFTDAQFPDRQKKVAYDYALQYIETLTAHIWPGIWQTRQSFDFDQFIDLTNRRGKLRFDGQFFRANIDPTELYVMSFTNSSSHRLKTDQSGYENLYITGDWIDNGFNAGCVEATVMAALQTARAISGFPIVIPGEDDF